MVIRDKPRICRAAILFINRNPERTDEFVVEETVSVEDYRYECCWCTKNLYGSSQGIIMSPGKPS